MSKAKKIHRTHVHRPAAKHSPESSGAEFLSRDFPQYRKNSLWYFGIGILALGLAILAINYRNYLMAAVVVAASLAIYSNGNLTPKSRRVRVSERGVMWGDEFLGYHQLKAFWLSRQGDQTAIYLERPNLSPDIHLYLPDAPAEQVIVTLATYLPFHHHRDEPIGDRFSRLLRL